MKIEVSEQISNELHRRAQAAGVNVGVYLEALVLATTAPAAVDASRPLSTGEWRAMVNRSGATSLRNGKSWRELAHEGHKY